MRNQTAKKVNKTTLEDNKFLEVLPFLTSTADEHLIEGKFDVQKDYLKAFLQEAK